jgi:hypothetical protein
MSDDEEKTLHFSQFPIDGPAESPNNYDYEH